MTNGPQKFDFKAALRLTGQGRLKEAVALIKESLPTQATQPAMPEMMAGLQSRAAALVRKFAGPQAATAPAAAARPGGNFETHHFTGAAGSRDYKLYVPASYRGQAMPLVMMLHGCSQNPDDFAIGTRMNTLAEQQGFLVAYPAQKQIANVSRCWNWFKAADQMRDLGEPSLLAGIAREIEANYKVQTGKVYAAGLSAGAAMALVLAAIYPDVFAAVGVHSGLPFGAATDAGSAFAIMQQGAPETVTQRGKITVPMIVFQGTADKVVNPINAIRIAAQSAAATLPETVSLGQANGLSYVTREHRDEGNTMLEEWTIDGAGHAWSGGDAAGSFTEPRGPDASREMLRFFWQH